MVIQAENILKRYGRCVAVNDATLTADTGVVLGLVGPNGAGKTTILRILATAMRADSGTVALFGCTKAESEAVRRRIGYLPDFFGFYPDMQVWDCVESFTRIYGYKDKALEKRVTESLELTGILSMKNQLIGELSRGMTQRLGFSVAYAHEPDLYILDEPFSGMDPDERGKLAGIIKNLAAQGKTILISSHILSEIDTVCTHTAFMNKGSIVLSDSILNLQKQCVPWLKITFLTDADTALKKAERFLNSSKSEIKNNTCRFQTDADDKKRSELASFLISEGHGFSEFSLEASSLSMLYSSIIPQGENV